MTSMLRSRRSIARHIAAIVAFSLIAAACGGGGDDETSPTTTAATTTQAPQTTAPTTTASGGGDTTTTTVSDEPRTASFRGITEDEIHIGISMLDFEALQEFNLEQQGRGDQQGIYQAFIDEVNANGGINGRMIVPHYEFYSPLGSTEAEAACVALTQDIETFAVLGGFFGPAEVVNNCIVTQNETVLWGGRQTAERLEQAIAPWVDNATLRERRLDVFLNLLDQTGRLEGRSVAVIGSIEQEDIFNKATEALERVGITPVLEALNDVPQGDVIAADQRWQVLAENVRASGADTVLVIGSTQAAMRGTARNGLDVERWVLENTGLENLGEQTNPADAHGAVTLIGLTDQQQWDHETMRGCRDTIEAAYPDQEFLEPLDHVDGDERWFWSIHLYCRNVTGFTQVMTAAGVNPTHDSFRAAMESTGELVLPGMPFASLGPGKPDLSDTFQLAEFDENEGEAGGLVPISEILDGTP